MCHSLSRNHRFTITTKKKKMKPESLFASASINLGLALTILSLFSILKKQPSNSLIYYARRLGLSQQQHIIEHHSIYRFLPSVSWIAPAFRVSELEILHNNGLDALIIIRLFKFGIKFFVASSILGLVVLLPVNYYSTDGSSTSYSMDSFTISNIGSGSNRLWVHFTCLWVISLYGLYLLHKEYKEILSKRIEQLRNVRRHPDQFSVLVREVPICDDHKSRTCSVEHFFSKHHPHTYHSHQMLYDDKELQILLTQAATTTKKIENIRYKSASRRRNGDYILLGASQEDDKKIASLEERLQKLCHQIRYMQVECICKQKELPVAFVTFKSRWGATLAAQSQQHSNPLLWITEMAPEPRDVVWRNLATRYRYLLLCRIGIILGAALLTIFFAIPVTAVQGIAKFDKLRKWFPPAMALQLIPGLRSIITGYLPSVILNGFMYVVPFAMLAMAKLAGCISYSKAEIKSCDMVFYFLVGNVFFFSLISGSLLDEIGESFSHPRDIPSRLASAVSGQADFFMTYILTDGLSGFSLELLQPGLLSWDFVKLHTFGRGKMKDPYLFSLPFFRVIPTVSLAILIGMVYVIIAPLLLPFLIAYFFLGYAVYINQIQDVYEIIYETCGQYWPYIHHYIVIAIILMQITMIGLFGLKSKPAASISTIPLLLFTLMFNEYCKRRFLPSFKHYSIQNAVQNDELDEKIGLLEVNYEKALNAYSPPCLQPVNFSAPESSSTQPLIISSV